MATQNETRQASDPTVEPVEVDPRPHWIPFVVIIGIAVPLMALMVLGAILFR